MTRKELRKFPKTVEIGGMVFDLQFLDRQTGSLYTLDTLQAHNFNKEGHLIWLEIVYME